MGSISDTVHADALLIARAKEAVAASEYGGDRFVGFLDERQRAVLEGAVGRRVQRVRFYGGYPEAERTVMGAGGETPPEEQDYPIVSLALHYRAQSKLSHRDVLGSALACGIKRETLGDILCGEGLAVLFALPKPAQLLAETLTRVGGEGVRVECPYTGELPQARQYQPLRGTVASPRIDAVLHILCGVSREQAAESIRAGLVLQNHAPCQSVSATVKEGDVLSVRGTGRFVVDELSDQTRKGRLILAARKYL